MPSLQKPLPAAAMLIWRGLSAGLTSGPGCSERSIQGIGLGREITRPTLLERP